MRGGSGINPGSYRIGYRIGYQDYRAGSRNRALDYGAHRQGYLQGWRDAVEFEQSELERVPDLPYRVGGVPVERSALDRTASYVRQVLGVDARVIGRHVWAAESVVVLQAAVDAWNESRAIKVQTPRPKRCGHCQREFWGALHDCFPPEHCDEPSDVIGGL